MRSIAVSRTLALLLTTSFFVSGLALAQQERREEVRPRRTQTENNNASTQTEARRSGPASAPQTDKHGQSPISAPVPDDTQTGVLQPPATKWNVVDRSVTQVDTLTSVNSGAEPVMRIGLATDVRAATVSTNAGLMSATDLAQTLVP